MKIIINGNEFPVEIMKTPDEISRGMMGRNELKGGMVFVLKKGIHSFWMENTLIPLDIVFILNNRISQIYKNCTPCSGDCTKHYTGIGDHVVEFPSGTSDKFKIGDKVNLYIGTPSNPVI
jgi:uncharacterized membrane protein (UPF0127 family)